jgi:superfamily II DNA or RNA helicase
MPAMPPKPAAPRTPLIESTPLPKGAVLAVGRFVPRLTLQTLTRGDGLLGMRAVPGFGPRSSAVTIARIVWTYTTDSGLKWECQPPKRILNGRGKSTELLSGSFGRSELMQRDVERESDAHDALWGSGLRALPPEALQWRHPDAGEAYQQVWSLPEETQFADFWADVVPTFQAQGWSVVVWPGFAHLSVPIEAWRLLIDEDTGGEQGRELSAPLGPRPAEVTSLHAPRRQGSWMLTLGVDVDGEKLDLAPMLADLLKRDARWLDAREIANIADDAIVNLRAPGGRRIEAPAAPIKAILGAMVDLLTDPQRGAHREGPLQLSTWEAHRLEALRQGLADTAPQRAGAHGQWQLQGHQGLSQLVQRLQGAGTPPPITDVTLSTIGLQLTLRPYQRHGVAWLQYLREHHLAGILADDMGLGKTAQVLAHLLTEKHAGRLTQPALVVLPTSLISNWEAESARISPGLRVLTLQGSDRSKAFARMDSHDVVFTTYPLLWRDIDVLARQPWHLLILDEAQTVKNAGSRAANAIRKLQAEHRLCVTGTPLENHLGELWAHFDFLMPGFLGEQRNFTRLWRKPIETNGDTARAAWLAQRVRPFILRRRKEDVATELPPKTEVIRRVKLEGHQRDLYESVRVAADKQVRRALDKQGFSGSQIAILDALLKLRQVCCDPRLLKSDAVNADFDASVDSAKMALLREMLPELVSEGSRVLVFSQFTEMLALVEQELHALSLPYLMLTGDTEVSQRGEVVRRFQAREAPIFLLSLKAGGVGLNLTAADTVIHLDPWWNPAVEQQATDRAHRIGQDQPVFVYKLVVEGSIEERMLALQSRKSALADGVLGKDGAHTTKFSQSDLEGLLAPLAEPDEA